MFALLRYLATTPATYGAAAEVPDIITTSSSGYVDRMSMPGAKRSTHGPQLVKLADVSLMSLAATVMALGALAGVASQAFMYEFPAATTTTMPAWYISSMMSSTPEFVPGEYTLMDYFLTLTNLSVVICYLSKNDIKHANHPAFNSIN